MNSVSGALRLSERYRFGVMNELVWCHEQTRETTRNCSCSCFYRFCNSNTVHGNPMLCVECWIETKRFLCQRKVHQMAIKAANKIEHCKQDYLMNPKIMNTHPRSLKLLVTATVSFPIPPVSLPIPPAVNTGGASWPNLLKTKLAVDVAPAGSKTHMSSSGDIT